MSYRPAAAFGHFGREDCGFSWEETGRAAQLAADARARAHEEGAAQVLDREPLFRVQRKRGAIGRGRAVRHVRTSYAGSPANHAGAESRPGRKGRTRLPGPDPGPRARVDNAPRDTTSGRDGNGGDNGRRRISDARRATAGPPRCVWRPAQPHARADRSLATTGDRRKIGLPGTRPQAGLACRAPRASERWFGRIGGSGLLRPAHVARAIDSVRKPALRSAGPSGSGTAPPGTGPERSGSSAAPAPGARHARRMPRPIAVPYRVRSRPHGLRTRAGRVPRRAGARSPGRANVGRDGGCSKARTTRQAVDGPSRTARW